MDVSREIVSAAYKTALAACGVEHMQWRLDDVLERMSEPHRHYHTLEHVAEMLMHLPPAEVDPASTLAAVYHDIVYDPPSATNEVDSAELAVEHLSGLGTRQETVKEVQRLILATAHFDDSSEAADGEAVDRFLDADLTVLAASEEKYRVYAENIRREYQHVPDDVFYPKRCEVLLNFLKRDRIYRLPEHDAWEAIARDNIRQEIERHEAEWNL